MGTESRGAGVWLLTGWEVPWRVVMERYLMVNRGCILAGFDAYFTPVLTFSSEGTSSSTEQNNQKTRRFPYLYVHPSLYLCTSRANEQGGEEIHPEHPSPGTRDAL